MPWWMTLDWTWACDWFQPPMMPNAIAPPRRERRNDVQGRLRGLSVGWWIERGEGAGCAG